jgi:hypothetical protein
MKSSGKGLTTANGDLITAHVDMSVQQGTGQSHLIANDTQMTFVSADCGDVKPGSVAPPAPDSPPAGTPPSSTE